MRTAMKAVVFALAGFLVSCQGPDVGQPCTVADFTGSPFPATSTVSADWVQTSNLDCENTSICIRSPLPAGSKIASLVAPRCVTQDSSTAKAGTNCGYCSKPCVSNSDCYQSTTGLECRSVVLDPAFIAQMSPEVRQTFLGDATASSYCAAPLP